LNDPPIMPIRRPRGDGGVGRLMAPKDFGLRRNGGLEL